MSSQDETKFDIFLDEPDKGVIETLSLIHKIKKPHVSIGFLESRPVAIKEAISWDEAIDLQEKFTAIGAKTFILREFKKWEFLPDPDFKKSVVTAFNNPSEGYGTNGDFHWNHARELVEYTNLRPGQRVLDVATGTGPAAIMAAQIVGPTGSVIGTDISSGMLAQARRNIEVAGLAGQIQLVEGDAENLPFEDASFDVILCSSAVPWFLDIPKAFQEFHRVLKPDSQFTFSCWGGEAKATRTNLLNVALEPFGKSIPELNGRINNPRKTDILLRAAGFRFVNSTRTGENTISDNAEIDFNQNWPGISSRFGISISGEELKKVKSGYIAGFEEMSRINPKWKYDYVQFQSAFKDYHSEIAQLYLKAELLKHNNKL